LQQAGFRFKFTKLYGRVKLRSFVFCCGRRKDIMDSASTVFRRPHFQWTIAI